MVTFFDFHAEWCGPCKQLDPIVEELESEYDEVDFRYIDIDENTELANKYTVRSVPTIVITKDGGMVERFTGVTEKSVLADAIESHM